MKRKILWIVIGVVVLLATISSGWVYNLVSKNNQLEMVALQATFVQQYGSQATIKQLVSPNKVYAALWTDSEGVSHVSWNIGGFWCVVWSENSPNTIP